MVNILGFEGHTISIVAIQGCCMAKQPQAILRKWVRLCSNEIFLQKQVANEPSSVNPWHITLKYEKYSHVVRSCGFGTKGACVPIWAVPGLVIQPSSAYTFSLPWFPYLYDKNQNSQSTVLTGLHELTCGQTQPSPWCTVDSTETVASMVTWYPEPGFLFVFYRLHVSPLSKYTLISFIVSPRLSTFNISQHPWRAENDGVSWFSFLDKMSE